MRTLVKGLAVLAAIVWSLVAWGSYALIGWVGGFAAQNADAFTGHPETVVFLSWAASVLTSVGLAGVVVAWLFGLALILVAPAVIGRFARRMR